MRMGKFQRGRHSDKCRRRIESKLEEEDNPRWRKAFERIIERDAEQMEQEKRGRSEEASQDDKVKGGVLVSKTRGIIPQSTILGVATNLVLLKICPYLDEISQNHGLAGRVLGGHVLGGPWFGRPS